MTKPATIVDVAKRAGVAVSTVSHALSGKRTISQETKDRINIAIAELGYQPNLLARGLVRRKSEAVTLLFPKMTKGLTEMQLEFVFGIMEAAREYKYSLVLRADPVDEAELNQLVTQGFSDGLILMEITMHDPRVEFLKKINFPFCMIGRQKNNRGLNYVDINFEKALSDSVTYLHELNHTNIAYINHAASLLESGYGPAIRSYKGYENCVTKLHLPLINEECMPTTQDGYEIVTKLLSENPDLSAIITINEAAINGMIRAIHDFGKRIPDDFSIIALASERRAEACHPKLTTMDFPAETEGRIAFDILYALLEEKDIKKSQNLLDLKLIVRDSTAPFKT